MHDKDIAHGSIPGGVEAAYSRGKNENPEKSGKGGRMARKVGRKHGRKRGRKHGKK
jgi:hypothetical protein